MTHRRCDNPTSCRAPFCQCRCRCQDCDERSGMDRRSPEMDSDYKMPSSWKERRVERRVS